MKVYVVMEHIAYESGTTLAVYSTKEKAEERVSKEEARGVNTSYELREFEIDEDG